MFSCVRCIVILLQALLAFSFSVLEHVSPRGQADGPVGSRIELDIELALLAMTTSVLVISSSLQPWN